MLKAKPLHTQPQAELLQAPGASNGCPSSAAGGPAQPRAPAQKEATCLRIGNMLMPGSSWPAQSDGPAPPGPYPSPGLDTILFPDTGSHMHSDSQKQRLECQPTPAPCWLRPPRFLAAHRAPSPVSRLPALSHQPPPAAPLQGPHRISQLIRPNRRSDQTQLLGALSVSPLHCSLPLPCRHNDAGSQGYLFTTVGGLECANPAKPLPWFCLISKSD